MQQTTHKVIEERRMPDISMCHGEGCEKKDTCYRHTAKPSPFMQSYIAPEPKDCKHYWIDPTQNNINADSKGGE